VSALELRPRSASELVDAAFRLLRHHYGAFVLLSALSQIPTLLVQLVQSPTLGADEDSRVLRVAAIYLLAVPYYAFSEGALIALASDAYRTGEARVGRAIRHALSRALHVTAALLLVGLAIGAGLVALLLPGLYLILRLYTTQAAAVLEGVGPAEAMRRTWSRTRGRVGHMLAVIGLMLLLYLVLLLGAGTVAAIVGALGAALGDELITLGAAVLVTVLVYPMLPIITTLLYYDLRIRAEGYDLEVMSEQLGGVSLGAGAAVP
jgi:hypothetical protein